MANVLDLRRRIRSVKNTRQITKAMKMVSAAKLRRAQERAVATRPYAQMITSVLKSLKHRIDIIDEQTGELKHPLFATRPEQKILLLVVSGDKGFAGAFNTNILKATGTFLDAHTGKQIDIEPVGRKARDFYRRRFSDAAYLAQEDEHAYKQRDRKGETEIIGDHTGFLAALNHSSVLKLAKDIVSRYKHEEIDSCYIIFNEFKSVIQQSVVVEQILPIIDFDPHVSTSIEMSKDEREHAMKAAATAGVPVRAADTTEVDEEAKKFGTASVDYIYEQPPIEIFEELLPQYLSTKIFHALSDSVASEHAARMTAMDSATNNASEMIDKYTLQMNRVRQAAITKEIIEIVSGAAAV